MRPPFLAAAVVVAGIAAPRPAPAQTAAELLQRAYTAYQNLDLPTAVGLIQRALAMPSGDSSVTRADRARALSVLAAAELFRGSQDSAASAFRQLVLVAPRYRPDANTFPPPVLLLFDDVRRAVKVIELSAPDTAEIRLGAGSFPLRAYASSVHDVVAQVIRGDGRPVRELYRGPVGDSLLLDWDARDSTGAPAPSGSYLLRAESVGPGGAVVRVAQVSMELELVRRDTLALPPRPDSQLLPERTPSGPALRAVGAGLVLAAAAILLPAAMGGGHEATETRFAIGALAGVAGFAGFFAQRPGRLIPENVGTNQAAISEWRARRDSLARENDERRRDIRVRIKTGRPVRIDPGGP